MFEGFIAFLLFVIAVLTVMVFIAVRKRDQSDVTTMFTEQLHTIARLQEQTAHTLREELTQQRLSHLEAHHLLREELSTKLHTINESLFRQTTDMRNTLETRLQQMQTDNQQKLDAMRELVDQKLHHALEKRLGESFRLVSDKLEQVHKGLGEMQSLANGVGDLKRVLTNVKTRGTWGEVQLGTLLEQMLSPEQYAANVATKAEHAGRVEFAIRIPRRHDDQTEGFVWLPIDAKFPLEDYQRLVAAHEESNLDAIEHSAKQLELRVKQAAKEIRDKYLDPPHTTEFALMFLPTEGLYAEVLRKPGLTDQLQRDYRILVTGPSTLAAILNSLQVGFQTIVIQKRSHEVWQLLGTIKTEFHKFGDIIDKVHKKLQEAANVVDKAKIRTRAIERQLKGVEALPATEVSSALDLDEEHSTEAMLAQEDVLN